MSTTASVTNGDALVLQKALESYREGIVPALSGLGWLASCKELTNFVATDIAAQGLGSKNGAGNLEKLQVLYQTAAAASRLAKSLLKTLGEAIMSVEKSFDRDTVAKWTQKELETNLNLRQTKGLCAIVNDLILRQKSLSSAVDQFDARFIKLDGDMHRALASTPEYNPGLLTGIIWGNQKVTDRLETMKKEQPNEVESLKKNVPAMVSEALSSYRELSDEVVEAFKVNGVDIHCAKEAAPSSDPKKKPNGNGSLPKGPASASASSAASSSASSASSSSAPASPTESPAASSAPATAAPKPGPDRKPKEDAKANN